MIGNESIFYNLPSNEVDFRFDDESGIYLKNDSFVLGGFCDDEVWKLSLNDRKMIFDAYNLGGPYTFQEEFCAFCCEELVNYYILTNDYEKLIIWMDWGNCWYVARYWEGELQQYIGIIGGHLYCYGDGWDYCQSDGSNRTELEISLDDQGMIDLNKIGMCLEKALKDDPFIHKLNIMNY